MFGICHAADKGCDVGIIVLNAGLLHNVGPFRLHVDLANRLCGSGYTTLLIDQTGKGESPARPRMTTSEAVCLDYDDAMGYLSRSGITRTVLIGLCSGADDAIRIAESRDSVDGIVMLDGYAPRGWRYYWRRYRARLFNPAAWRRLLSNSNKKANATEYDAPMINIRKWDGKADMLEHINRFLIRKGRMLAVFTGGVADYYNHDNQLAASLVISSGLTEIYLPDVDHTYRVTFQRNELVERIVLWVNENMQ